MLHDARRPCGDVASYRKESYEGKLKQEPIGECLSAVQKARRTTFRCIAAALDLSRSTLHDYYKRGIFLSLQHVHATNADLFSFEGMTNVAHVHEKWFFVLVRRKDTARGTSRNVPAQRGWCNQPAGALETKRVSVTCSIYKNMLIDQVIPAIKANWGGDSRDLMYIQQDNARLHVPPSDTKVVAACTSDDWNVQLVCQPPNSSDLNLLDLGFFRTTIQAIQEKNYSRRVDDIIAATEAAWLDVHKET
ncbi:hypothetical protein H257_05964 [Aphanomyces astaci]|uniref:Tc1-like transposase DDE domain-containing protein n=1 Tax=Aphanomyces astaci TaxID=112090 RepID=W4GNY3_APHAT|nr:hypothetical protein H257_05964 [Aphanomyces astaci]ETV81440.1 hypothetical protein H257_05964 [Aphanomyces astaci]|eukprot:XP_009829298.1 hypothetical protein H257_05964 [Aphanomyces astaci]